MGRRLRGALGGPGAPGGPGPGGGPAEAGGVWSRSRRRLTLGLVLTVSAAAFEALATATSMPATARDLGGLAWYGWAFSGFMLANIVGVTAAGAALDRQGATRPFVAGVALFSVGLLTAGLAPAMPVVVAGRVIQGLGAGYVSSVAYVSVRRGYPQADRPAMLALLSTAWVVPGLIGPAVAGTLADNVSWRAVFLGLAPLVPLAAVLPYPALRRLGERPAPAAPGPGGLPAGTGGRWRVVTALVLAAGTALLLAGLTRPSVPSLALATVGLGAMVPAARRLLLDGIGRGRPGLLAAMAVHGLVSFAFFGAEAFLPLALTSVRGQSSTAAGLALTAATVTWTAGSWTQARLAPRGRWRLLVTTGLAVLFAGITGVAAVLLPAVPVPTAALAWGFGGIGMGVVFSTCTLVILQTTEPERAGAASAAMQLAQTLGVALGTGLGGAGVALAASGAWPVRDAIGATDGLSLLALVLAMVAAARLPRGPGDARRPRPAPGRAAPTSPR
ncbi:MAG TPA: MFS transporter [Actinomycetes bacterium]|nr:MFS transporter [Actinomycetes bacterium]